MIKFFRKIRQNLLIENKMGKYFKYAIGEIILVVIGILIALQINNWNENKKKRLSWKTYTESLIKDLKQDTITLNMVTNYIHQDSMQIEKLTKRLSAKTANFDTLKKITRYEINFNSKAYRPPNNKTFLAMQANGTIELFDKLTYEQLLDLQTKQAIASSIIVTNNNAFITQINNITSKFSVNLFRPIQGPLLENAWKNVDETELFRTVQGFLTSKKMMNQNTRRQYLNVLSSTEKVLSRLTNLSKDKK